MNQEDYWPYPNISNVEELSPKANEVPSCKLTPRHTGSSKLFSQLS